MGDTVEPEVSVVMPCLNEARTLATCIEKALSAFRRLRVPGEVVVADNGSEDGSREIARARGARVVEIAERGYGTALRGGIEAAKGRYIIMGDADDSYDFSALDPFIDRLRAGNDLVMGNRFKGGIRPGAMPWKHRWLGNPVLTGLGRLFFRSPVGDFHCGLRAFTREAYGRMDLRTTGMEFASEMVIKSTILGFKIDEVPVVLHKDGRDRPPHLRSWRDGWRHLRFMLLFSPLWLFLVPGALLSTLGLAGGLWLVGGARRLGALELDVHSLLGAGLFCLVGFQLLAFAGFTKAFAVAQGLHPPTPAFRRFDRCFSLERGLILSISLGLAGLALLALSVIRWREVGFGDLDVRSTMRRMIPGAILLTLGVQSAFSSFLLSVLRLGERARRSSQGR